MSDILFSLHSWPQAIVHIDGDAFFTSCEEAILPLSITGIEITFDNGPQLRLVEWGRRQPKGTGC